MTNNVNRGDWWWFLAALMCAAIAGVFIALIAWAVITR
jgi:hypothetical protein